jgi:CubicO group peptidase (beta-lactamase class C family)
MIRVPRALPALVAVLFISRGLLRADDVDDLVTAHMRSRHIPGLSLVVVREGKVIKASAYGLANVETNTAATPDTVYKIGSISKPFIAAGILLLVEAGKLRLDDKAAPYLRGAPQTWNDISIRHLLSHTSGLIEDPPGFTPFQLRADQDVIASLYDKPLLFPPGENWSYSNAGYFVLGEIISRVSEQPWSTFVAERVFTPALMTRTRTTTSTDLVSGRASGYYYRWADERWENAPNWIALRPSGAFLSTALDLARWDVALDSDAVLNHSLRELMWTPVKLNNGRNARCGLGWFVDSWRGHKRVHHDGQLPGFHADYERFVDDRLSVIVLFNEDGISSPKPLALRVAGCYIPALKPPRAGPIADPEPPRTAAVRRLVARLAQGDLETSLCAPELVQAVTPPVAAMLAAQLRHQEPSQFEPLERIVSSAYTTLRYRLVYPDDDFVMRFVFDRDNLIAGLFTEFD